MKRISTILRNMGACKDGRQPFDGVRTFDAAFTKANAHQLTWFTLRARAKSRRKTAIEDVAYLRGYRDALDNVVIEGVVARILTDDERRSAYEGARDVFQRVAEQQ